MKKQLMLFVLIFCAGLQSNLSLCAEKTLWQKIYDYFSSGVGDSKIPGESGLAYRPRVTDTRDLANFSIVDEKGDIYPSDKKYALTRSFQEKWAKGVLPGQSLGKDVKYGIKRAAGTSVSLSTGYAVTLGGLAAFLGGDFLETLKQEPEIAIGIPVAMSSIISLFSIMDIVVENYYLRNFKTYRKEAIQEIKEVLRKAISSDTLYPTRSSKIHALMKKEDFLEYASLYAMDVRTVLDDACASLIEEINNLPYIKVQDNDTETNKKIKIKNVLDEESRIDAELSFLRNHFRARNDSIESQIKALEMMINEGGPIALMRACLSFYYRLLNKLEIEKILTPEQKSARKGGWDYTIAEGLTPEKIAERRKSIEKEQSIETEKALQKQEAIKKLGGAEAYEAMRTQQLNKLIGIKSTADNANDGQENE